MELWEAKISHDKAPPAISVPPECIRDSLRLDSGCVFALVPLASVHYCLLVGQGEMHKHVQPQMLSFIRRQ